MGDIQVTLGKLSSLNLGGLLLGSIVILIGGIIAKEVYNGIQTSTVRGIGIFAWVFVLFGGWPNGVELKVAKAERPFVFRLVLCSNLVLALCFFVLGFSLMVSVR